MPVGRRFGGRIAVKQISHFLGSWPGWLVESVVIILAVGVLVIYVTAFLQGRQIGVGPLSVGPRNAGAVPGMAAGSTPAVQPSTPTAGPEGANLDPSLASGQTTRWRKHAVIAHDVAFGIDELADKVAEFVRNDRGTSVTSLSGEGGVGKTTLAYEVVERCRLSGGFTDIAWASAKNSNPAAGSRGAAAIGAAYWQDAVRSISEQFGVPLSRNRSNWEGELTDHVGRIDVDRRLLLILDNLESSKDTESTVRRLLDYGFRRPHKVIVTTRWALTGGVRDVRDIEVPRLSPTYALEMIRHLGKFDGGVSGMSDRELEPIFQVTEGNPYLITKVVTLYLETRRTLSAVISDLVDLNSAHARGSGVAQEVLDYLYMGSLEELARRSDAEAAESLIGAFIARPKGDSISYADLHTISGITNKNTFDKALTDACKLNLVNASNNNSSYSIHSLLYEFTRAK